MSAGPAVWVVGGTGYSGAEAVRLLRGHPSLRLERVFASPGGPSRDLETIDPVFLGSGLRAEPFALESLEDAPAAVLLALPDDAAARLAPAFLERGSKVVDLSGAFRVRDAAHYPRHCGFAHQDPSWLDRAVYGLTERARGRVREATLVANPGCYPTAALLALLPPEEAGLLDPGPPLVIDAKSGVTGAGRKVEAAYLFAEVDGNLKAYGALRHRHVPEIRQALGLEERRDLLFVPHLLPVARGLLVTVYVTLREGAGGADLSAAYAAAYRGSAFVRFRGEGRWPEIRDVVRTNRCDIGFVVDEGRRSAVIVAALDNLLKGAAGQAVQNLNLMLGLGETEGLPS